MNGTNASRTEAMEQERTDICMIAGARKDQCLVSLVPLLKNNSICDDVTDASYKDDCYIELAGANKNDTYCSDMMNSSKVQLCEQAAMPIPQINQTQTNVTTTLPTMPQNQTGNSKHVDNATEAQANAFMNYIDNTTTSALHPATARDNISFYSSFMLDLP